MKNQTDSRIIQRILANIQEQRKLIMLLSCLVVFTTTYLLILPAFTLDKEEAAEQGGIDVPAVESEAEEVSDEDTGHTSSEAEAATEAKTEDNTMTKDEAENEAESKADAPSQSAAQGDTLTFEGDGFTVAVEDKKSVLPDNTEVVASELLEKHAEGTKAERKEAEEAYRKYYDLAQEAVKGEDGADDARTISFVKFYDISLQAAGEDVQPDKPVNVTISYDKNQQKELTVEEKKNIRIIHFAEDKETGEISAEILKDDSVDVSLRQKQMEETTFEAESFSVYAVVYTVDFSYEVNGNEYSFTMKGEDSVSLRTLIETLHVYEKAESKPEDTNAALDQFIADIESVTFSDPELIAVCKAEEDTTLGKLKHKNGIIQNFSLWHPQKEVVKRNSAEYKAGDWALISLKPFDTKETLTITLKSGEILVVDVTDAQDAVMNPDGTTVQTISNPAGTTINLFDYWVDTGLRYNDGRSAWPGYTDGWSPDENNLGGTGNEAGINAGHALKFSPAWEHTVINGTAGTDNVNGRNGLNSYTGGTDPFQGIVQKTLDGGYPKLTVNPTIGSDGESLAYLFDPDVSNDFRKSYTGVNQLMYVDRDGYYTFDSRDYYARYNDDKTFTVTKQTTSDSRMRGFWPFNDQDSRERNFWMGMHVDTQFSMPAGGQVLNPSNELKPMQFEFSGDDDVWIYVDGVLIGDAGGVHNRTEVDINFKTGQVTITGKEPAYLDDLFSAAGKYDTVEWNGHTFKDGTYHTFDFFYLERGGEESNLYIHYNLVSTADFTAHKSFHGTNEDDLLKRDQFRFELIGLDGKYRSVKNEATDTYELVPDADGANAKAIMPKAVAGGEGTVASPYYNGDTTTTVNGATVGSQTYRTGVTEDGNVNFGTADISEQDMLEADNGNPPVYRYIVREIVPEDAVNDNGTTWAEASESERAAGGFVKDDIIYDGTVYYMTGRVTSWKETGPNGQEIIKHGLSKTYYTDDTFTTVKENTPFISFVNAYNAKHGSVEFTKKNQDKEVLPGAKFALFRDEACLIPAKMIDVDNSPWTATSDSDGKVSFENVRVGTYYMKETEAPPGYGLDNTVYKVVIEDAKDTTKTSKITILGDESETPIEEVINAEEGKLTVEKKWLNRSGREIDGGDHTAKVNLYRRVDSSEAPQSTLVKVKYHRDGATWDLDVGGGKTEVVVNDASSFELNWHLGNDSSHYLHDMKVNGVLYENAQNDTIDTGYGKITWTPWDGSTSRMIVTDIRGDLNIEFDSTCDWFSTKPALVNKTDYTPPSTETEFVETITLDPSNDWTVVKKLGGTLSDFNAEGYDLPATDDNGYHYLYFVKERDTQGNEIEVGGEKMDGFVLAGYSPNNSAGVSDQGVITVYNKESAANTVDVVIKKTDDAENSTNYLAGAVFKLLYRADSEGTFADVSSEQVPELDADSQFVVPEEGITLTGLIDGQYQLQEIAPPTGYVITETAPVAFTVSDGAITSTDGTVESVRYTAAAETKDAEFIIPNTPGAELPHTGGIGTTIFYILGTILMTGCAIVLISRRRLRND